MLAYPNDPAGVLAEAARVTRGPIILVQSLHSDRLGYAWLRVREFLWTIVAFHVSKVLGYVPPDGGVHHAYPALLYRTGRFGGTWTAAGLRIRSRRERPLAARPLSGGRRVDPHASLRSVCKRHELRLARRDE